MRVQNCQFEFKKKTWSYTTCPGCPASLLPCGPSLLSDRKTWSADPCDSAIVFFISVNTVKMEILVMYKWWNMHLKTSLLFSSEVIAGNVAYINIIIVDSSTTIHACSLQVLEVRGSLDFVIGVHRIMYGIALALHWQPTLRLQNMSYTVSIMGLLDSCKVIQSTALKYSSNHNPFKTPQGSFVNPAHPSR